MSRTLKSDLACPLATAAQIEDPSADGQWRRKVNPLFVGGIQFLQFISNVFRELQWDQDVEDQTARLFIESCKQTTQFLPDVLAEHSQIESGMEELSANFEGDSFFSNPEVRHALADIVARFASTPPDLLKKGFAQPHWWMPYHSWPEFFKKEKVAQVILNLLSLLHFQISLEELTQRVAEGDIKLYARLFRFGGKELKASSEASEKFLKNLDDRAMQVVGRALLLQGEPRGYQLRLRMVLFFGWDFGLADLSNNELYTFLTEMQVIPVTYDPESLRKYRNRMRDLIKKSLRPPLLKVPQMKVTDVDS